MKPLQKRAHGKEALVFRRAVAARLQILVAVLRPQHNKTELAKLMGVSKSHLSNWIRSDNPLLPSVEPLIRLCENKGCTLDYIYRGVLVGVTEPLASKIREAQSEIADDPAANSNRQQAPADRKPPPARRSAE
jgi:transcriptional regulator with XRE-family HTH domain